jgi:predicted nucleic acid-binding protein
MKKFEAPIQILLDNNVFDAAIHNPGRETKSLQLLLELIRNRNLHLVGNPYLLEEVSKYGEVYSSPTALLLLKALISKMEHIAVEDRYIKLCLNYMNPGSPVDIIHAATCLQTDSTLITNDKHFDQLKQEKIITIWNINEALKHLLP